MSKDKEITLFDDIEWGNKTLPGLSDEKLMNTNWNRVTSQKARWSSDQVRKEHGAKAKKWFKENKEEFYEIVSKANKDSVPDVVAISPEGKTHRFASLSEAEDFIKCGPLFMNVPINGMPYRGIRQAKKNWIFYRDVPNKKRKAEVKRLREIVHAKLNPVLTHPWRSPIWRASPEGQKYMAKVQKRKSAPNKKNKKVKTPDGIFNTNTAAAKFYGITPGSFYHRKLHHPTLYYNIETDNE